jgi:hypothetical protein
MRLSCAYFIGITLLSSGCSTATVMGVSGGNWVPLGTREEIHDALGTPAKVEVAEGKSFEEFQVRGGCDQIVLGCRLPAFQPLDELHIWGWGDLELIAVKDVGSIPAKGRNLIVVASIEKVLHFRIFDEDGKTIVDTDETRLMSKGRSIADLKNHLESMWPPHKLNEEEKHRIIGEVVSIVGRNPLGSFELAVGNVKTYGLIQIGTLPDEPKDVKHRVLPGQILRFDFDHLGKVKKVYLDGEFLLSPTPNSNPTVPMTSVNAQH